MSVYGPTLWWIGLPAANVSNELIVSFKLEDRKNNKVLWEKEYRDEVSHTSVIYSLNSDFEYPDMLKKILLNVVKDIKTEIPNLKTKLAN